MARRALRIGRPRVNRRILVQQFAGVADLAMKLGIMQPYFFPYLGYFDLINRADRWIVFDTAQYIRHGWVNRNRILHPQTGWQYIIAPVQKHHRETPIRDIRVSAEGAWRRRILGQLQHYRKTAPFFAATAALVEECLAAESTWLARLNVKALEAVCRYLSIPFNYGIFSEMNLTLPPVNSPGEWALRIAEALGADEYINPPGGAALFDATAFARSGIKLTIQKPVEFVYACVRYQFVPDLSVIDVMMWNPPEKIKAFLDANAKAEG